MLLSRVSELCLEVTLALSLLRGCGVAFVLRLCLRGFNCRPCIGKLTCERAVSGSRLGQLGRELGFTL